MQLTYETYLDKVYGGWIGKSMGGAAGARFEGYKGWIDIEAHELFPDTVPPNDDLDLQVLWLKVIEEKGPYLTSDDLAEAWLEGCWYPFNEYGIFRRNWRLGIHPPLSGEFTNQFWENGMGCPIRSEIWGFVFPGAPDLAARYALMDGTLDHTEQSVGGEQMLAAMASMAFFVSDVRRLAAMFIHYLPADTPIERLTRAAFQAYDDGLSLRDARDRLMMMEGFPEACDSQTNVPFTFLGLLYGENDLQETLLSALHCGYDTDCTLATAGALVGQILGAKRIPQELKDAVGDELVMGIEYEREELTLSALARDTCRMGVLMSREIQTGIEIIDAPNAPPLPATVRRQPVRMSVEYDGLPEVGPGESKRLTVRVAHEIPDGCRLTISAPPNWSVQPRFSMIDALHRDAVFTVRAPADVETWPMQNLFTARLESDPPTDYLFGIVGAGLWQFCGVYYDELPDEDIPKQKLRQFNHHFVSLEREYISESDPDIRTHYETWSRKLGRPALLTSYEHAVDPEQLIGLRGPYCCYVARELISPETREVWLVIGNNDGYRLYLNGEMVANEDEQVWWSPFNNAHRVTLRSGINRIFVKLLKRSDDLRFTFGVRAATDAHHCGQNCEDWLVDLADVAP